MKFYNYVFLIIGLSLLMEWAGIPVATNILTYVGLNSTSFNITSAGIYLAILTGSGILIGLGSAIAIGYITKSSTENYVILPWIIGGALIFFSVFGEIVNQAFNPGYPVWVSYGTLFIMGLLGVGFVISCLEFFRGTD